MPLPLRVRIESAMPEYPDVTIYVESLARRIVGKTLERVRIAHPFLLRTVDPRPQEACGRRVISVSRIGKRIVIGTDNEIFLVIHLMIAGRLKWEQRGTGVPRKIGLAAFEFGEPEPGVLILTEAGTKKRASLHVVRGAQALRSFDRGGIEVDGATPEELAAALRRENHTLKRALTDPRIVSGIGNAYSDEILHHARLSPFKQTRSLDQSEIERLLTALRAVLHEWTDRLRSEAAASGFPTKVTAFRKEMAVHGKFGQPCPVCGTKVQRIAYAENECNYCPTCQTEGKLLADRALSRLLKGDWPASVEELEQLRSRDRGF